MDRFNRDLLLTTSDAAELLSIHPSTVKRWCAGGDLRAERTEGGHRRFHLTDVLETARRRNVETYLDGFAPYEAHVWSGLDEVRSDGSFEKTNALAMGWLSRGRHDRLERLFEVLAGHPDVSLPRLLDGGIGGFLARVGDAWREGRLRVGEEHLVTQTLVEVLLRLRTRLLRAREGDPAPAPSEPRRAVVGSTEGDQHHVGALCVRLVLESEGWETLYLGPSVPVEDFASLQRARGASLVCLSFSPSATGAAPHRAVRTLETLYDPARPYSLALGGKDLRISPASAGVGSPFVRVSAFDGCVPFVEALRTGFGAAAPGRASAAVSGASGRASA